MQFSSHVASGRRSSTHSSSSGVVEVSRSTAHLSSRFSNVARSNLYTSTHHVPRSSPYRSSKGINTIVRSSERISSTLIVSTVPSKTSSRPLERITSSTSTRKASGHSTAPAVSHPTSTADYGRPWKGKRMVEVSHTEWQSSFLIASVALPSTFVTKTVTAPDSGLTILASEHTTSTSTNMTAISTTRLDFVKRGKNWID